MTAVDIARLPRKIVASGTPLYRIHRAHRGPWFFDDSDRGRFNPTGVPGRGACYWAEKPLGAWVEAFRTVTTLTSDDIAARALTTITLGTDLDLRDLTVKRALRAGVTVAITGGSDYAAPQALADGLQGIGDGVRYRVSHDMSARLIASAWFGEAGPAADHFLASLPEPVTEEVPDELVDSANRQFGYVVMPGPA